MNTPDRWLIHRRLAEDNDERLTLVTVIPEHITLIGADADTSRSLLAQRYPKATFAEYDPRADFLQAAADMRKLGLWQKLAGKNVTQLCQKPSLRMSAAACRKSVRGSYSINVALG